MFEQFRKCCFRVYAAGFRPSDKLGNIDSSISGFAIVNITMWFHKFFTYFSLGQTCTLSHFPKKWRENSIRHVVLGFRCHNLNFIKEFSWHELSAMVK